MPFTTECEKSALRRAVLQRRRPQGEAARNRLLRRLTALPQTEAAQTVFCYLSTPLEVSTHGFLEALWRQGRTVCLPRCEGDTMLAATADGWHDLGPPDKRGIRQPVGGRVLAPEDIDLAVVPGLLFDCRGYRLGYGGGYYDRWLAQGKVFSVGLCRAADLVKELPRCRHDLPVDLVVTDAKCNA